MYQHSDGYCLAEEVQQALEKMQRWDDEEYLTRIIFATMLKTTNSIDSELGFGIGTQEHGDIEYLVNVNTLSQKVIVLHKIYGKQFKTLFEGSFEEFCKVDVSAEQLEKGRLITA